MMYDDSDILIHLNYDDAVDIDRSIGMYDVWRPHPNYPLTDLPSAYIAPMRIVQKYLASKLAGINSSI